VANRVDSEGVRDSVVLQCKEFLRKICPCT